METKLLTILKKLRGKLVRADKTGRESKKISDETQAAACRVGAEISGFHFKITESRFVFLFKFVTVSVLSTVICVN